MTGTGYASKITLGMNCGWWFIAGVWDIDGMVMIPRSLMSECYFTNVCLLTSQREFFPPKEIFVNG